ncbi:MAG TPA: DPP IV N-terminal domain-containing protein [Candidatus Limnocylindria bacterium]|nr:DPP IV N-terminal domain-containing protein [Candidatus Limnocylindria bacterium]
MLSRFLRPSTAAVLAAACSLPCAAVAGEQLSVDAIVAHAPVSGVAPSGFTWAPDGSRYVYTLPGARESDPPVLHVHVVATGADRILLAARSSERGSRSREIGQIVWSPDARRIAFLDGENLEVASADGHGETVLAHGADDPRWSPDGTRLAYVHDDDLYVVEVASRHATRLTRSGSATRLNGDPDWLSSEELDVSHAYTWAPGGDAIAFLSFDETGVTDFPIQQYLPTDNTVEHQRYPLAGEKNPGVALHVVELRSGRVRTLYDGAPRADYLLTPVWTPDGRAVVDEIIDRPQRHLRLLRFPRDGGAARTLVAYSDPHFVEAQPEPIFLRDGRRFVWLSERTGVQGLDLVDAATGAARRLSGAYPVAAIARVDEAAGCVYVDARYPARRDRALLRIPLAGGRETNLTPEVGTHAATLPEHGAAFIDAFSSLTTPPRITRRSLRDGAVAATLFRTPPLARYDLGTTRVFQIPSRWGPLDAYLIEPPNFDPTHRYPVIVNAYGGPLPIADGLPSDDRWPGLYDHLLAEHGFLVFTVDGPASRSDRSADARMFSESMGTIAMAGQLAGVAWLKQQPYVDPTRLGLFGWSYGGYLTAFTLTHAPGVFRSGIAGAPVVDWRFYDSAYTERYMGTPRAEAAAYQSTSVLPAAGALHSQLLLLQGSSDDNVHLMNTITLLNAFVRAGKQVDYFVYPGARHGVRGIAATRHLETKMLDWWERTLR